jgi:chromosome segregation ATPase
MDESRTAEIIMFPTTVDRVARAMARLDDALAEQRVAVAAWRSTITDLHGAMGSLRASLATYESALSSVATRVDTLHDESRQLEAWADEQLASQST